jgi:hypothetical protein
MCCSGHRVVPAQRGDANFRTGIRNEPIPSARQSPIKDSSSQGIFRDHQVDGEHVRTGRGVRALG